MKASYDDRGICDPAMLQAIGRLVTVASYVELAVAVQLVRIMSPGDVIQYHCYPVVSGMDFKVKLAVLRSMSRVHTTHCEEIVKCCDKLQDLFQRRNEAAHSLLLWDEKKPGQIIFSDMRPEASTGLPKKPVPRTPADLYAWANRLIEWSDKLAAVLTDLGCPLLSQQEAETLARQSSDQTADSPDPNRIE